MTTQATKFTDTTTPAARLASADGCAESDSGDGMASDLKLHMRGMVDSGKARMVAWQGGVQSGIRERPIQSVLIATAIGTVIGLLIGRRSR
jgi:ElaB/YqjD/DUF883 family membrane-anchored ribosome-binding protein